MMMNNTNCVRTKKEILFHGIPASPGIAIGPVFLAKAKIRHLENKRADKLSGGETARMALARLMMKSYDLVILENVGNLVCPAEFDTGAVKNVTILSVPEGHDKPLKYPLMYQTCHLLVVNKIDVLPYFDFDMEKLVEYARKRNPDIEILPISAKTGEGIDRLADWILNQMQHKQK